MSDELRISRRTFTMGVLIGILILAIAATYLVFVKPMGSTPPPETNTPVTTRTESPSTSPTQAAISSPTEMSFAESMPSDQRLFTVSYTPVSGTIAINSMHEWTLHVDTADGEPVEGAEITVDGGMPEHGHGLPTVPQVTEDLGGGDYLVEGVKFQMPGWWVVTFHISANGQSDSVTFNLRLN